MKKNKESKNDSTSKGLIRELGFIGSRKEQKREQFNYDAAEKITECLVTPVPGSRTNKCNFEILIPSYLPATIALSSAEISYALFAICSLPNGKASQSSRELAIFRKNTRAIHLESSRTVSFPESPLAIKASFDTPDLGVKAIIIPTTLQLRGLNLPRTNSMRINETRWLVPREIRWGLEETAVLITGLPDGTGHVPMSTAHRVLSKREVAKGTEKLKLKYPFTRAGNTFVLMLEDNGGMEIPFNVTAPKDMKLGNTTALSVAGAHILHTVLDSETALDSGLPQRRFALYLEYKLHTWVRIGEDVFDETSGDLVNRKMDEMAYTVLCPLTMQQAPQQEVDDGRSGTPPPLIPPSYDGLWEQPLPDYTAHF